MITELNRLAAILRELEAWVNVSKRAELFEEAKELTSDCLVKAVREEPLVVRGHPFEVSGTVAVGKPYSVQVNDVEQL